MTDQRLAILIDHLIASLDRERILLLAGDYDTLAAEADARAAQLERLDGAALGGASGLEPRLEALRAAVRRNERLLRAALEGAAAGQRRLQEILTARATLMTYDASGAPVARGANGLAGRKA